MRESSDYAKNGDCMIKNVIMHPHPTLFVSMHCQTQIVKNTEWQCRNEEKNDRKIFQTERKQYECTY